MNPSVRSGAHAVVRTVSRSNSPAAGHASLRRSILTAVAGLTAYTVLTIVFPPLQIEVHAPDLRVVLETIGLSVALFTALALLLPGDGDVGVPRDAFVAALVALGVSNAVFGVGPTLIEGMSASGSALDFYPWLAGRYAAGVLFIAASVGRPRLGVRRYLLMTLLVLAVVDAVVLTVGDALPLPLEELEELRGGMSVRLASLWEHLLITAAPGVLFAVGAVLAWRVFMRTSAQLYLWLSLALWTQVLTQVHEIMYPAVLGPRITSADVFRSLVLVLLLLGASLKVRTLWLEREAAIKTQEQDLQTHRALLDASSAFTDQEEVFRSLVVHELATPIATLRAYVHVVTEQVDGTGHLARALDGLRTESMRLQALVGRMDELRAVDRGEIKLQQQPVLLRTLLDEVARYLSALPSEHRTEITCDDDVRVYVDPVRIGQALRNMVTNAASYAPDDTVVTLGGRRVGHGRVEISVTDRGPGIPAAERQRLLRQYQRGASSRGRQGTGLGLYLSRRIAEAHGGQISITAGERGLGARVSMEVAEA